MRSKRQTEHIISINLNGRTTTTTKIQMKNKKEKQQPEKHFPCETFIEIICWFLLSENTLGIYKLNNPTIQAYKNK